MQYTLSGVMTRHGGLHNTYYTRHHSIGTCDMLQEYVSSRAGFIIKAGSYSQTRLGIILSPF